MVVVGAVALIVAALPSPASARGCGDARPPSSVYFATEISVTGASCSTTTRMLRRWLVIDGPDYDPPGYRCRVSETSFFRCRGRGKRLSFQVRRAYRGYY